MSNDTDEPPLALSNEAAQPVRDPQPESSVDAALGALSRRRVEATPLDS